MISNKLVLQAVTVLRKANEKVFEDSSKKKPLLLSENESVLFLQVNLKKVPGLKQLKKIKIQLPHSLVRDTSEVCLIAGDLDKRDKKAEIDPDILHYKELLQKHGISCISEVVTLRQLRTEYKPYEAKQKLLAAYDLFLNDNKITECLPRVLGRHFLKKRKFPIQINMKSSNLKQQVEKALSTSIFYVSGHGNSCASEVAYLDMKDSEIVDNILAVAETLSNQLPGSWDNVMGVYLKTSLSKAIPIYVSYDDPNKVEIESEEEEDTYEMDELSTIPNKNVKVHKDGRIETLRIKKKLMSNEEELENEDDPNKVEIESEEEEDSYEIDELSTIPNKNVKVHKDGRIETLRIKKKLMSNEKELENEVENEDKVPELKQKRKKSLVPEEAIEPSPFSKKLKTEVVQTKKSKNLKESKTVEKHGKMSGLKKQHKKSLLKEEKIESSSPSSKKVEREDKMSGLKQHKKSLLTEEKLESFSPSSKKMKTRVAQTNKFEQLKESKKDTDCCNRCTYVRDYYIRCRGKPGTGSGGEAAKKRSDILSFWDSIPSSQRDSITNVVDERHETEITEDTHVDIEENLSLVDETENGASFNCNEHNINDADNNKGNDRKDEFIREKKKKKLTNSKERLRLLREIAQLKAIPAQNELDETHLFFSSMAKLVKKLPRYEQIQLRMQISSLVGNAELRSISIESRQQSNDSLKSGSTQSIRYQSATLTTCDVPEVVLFPASNEKHTYHDGQLFFNM